MKENIYLLSSVIIIFGVPLLLSIFFVENIYFITLIAICLLLLTIIINEEGPTQIIYGIFVGMLFIAVLLVLINPKSMIALKMVTTTETDINYTSLSAFDNPLQWATGGVLTGNGLIAFVAIMASLIFWIFGILGLKTKPMLQGISLLIGCMFAIEIFYVFIAPDKAAQGIGWFSDATQYLPSVGFGWLLVPLRMLAIVEYIALVFNTLGLALVICFSFLYINDFIAAKTGVNISKVKEMI